MIGCKIMININYFSPKKKDLQNAFKKLKKWGTNMDPQQKRSQ